MNPPKREPEPELDCITPEKCESRHKTWNRVLTLIVMLMCATSGAIGWAISEAHDATKASMAAVDDAKAVRAELNVHAAGETERDRSISATLARLERGQEEIFTLLRTK